MDEIAKLFTPGRGAIPSLLKLDEASLYRNLGEPSHSYVGLVVRITPALRAGIADRQSVPIQQNRLERIEDHRRAARDLRRCGERTVDPEQKATFERSAQMNEAIAATLESMPPELQIQEPTTADRRRVCLSALAAARYREMLIKMQQLTSPTVDNVEELEHLAKYIHGLSDDLDVLLREEERSRAEWGALEEAKRMVAESDGRAKFNQLVPDIRTRLCEQWQACEQVKRYEDETALTMAIADVLMTISATLPMATIAVLVVKIGVRKFCNCPA